MFEGACRGSPEIRGVKIKFPSDRGFWIKGDSESERNWCWRFREGERLPSSREALNGAVGPKMCRWGSLSPFPNEGVVDSRRLGIGGGGNAGIENRRSFVPFA